MGKSCPEWLKIGFLGFFKNFGISFLGNNLKWNLILLLMFHHHPICGKILDLELWAKILSTNQIAGFCKIITRKKCMMKFIFGILINIKVFYKLIISFWVSVTRHVQSTQNKKFAYLQKIMRDDLILCLQINTKVFYELIVLLWVCIVR